MNATVIKSELLLMCLAVTAILYGCTDCDRYRIESDSMAPTYKTGDTVIVCREYSIAAKSISRWDLILVTFPETGNVGVRRVLGLPGEHLEYSPSGFKIDGTIIEIPKEYIYIIPFDHQSDRIKAADSVSIPNDSLFIIGDNVLTAYDSRSFGPIKLTSILGRLQN